MGIENICGNSNKLFKYMIGLRGISPYFQATGNTPTVFTTAAFR